MNVTVEICRVES